MSKYWLLLALAALLVVGGCEALQENQDLLHPGLVPPYGSDVKTEDWTMWGTHIATFVAGLLIRRPKGVMSKIKDFAGPETS